jgi:uncharacterized phage protein (TIGR01671 family)
MSREIKFRAWNSKERQMSKSFTLHDIGDGRIRGVWSSPRLSFPITDCIMLQFTGLKDETGKEIYEGDVISEMRRHNKAEIRFGTFGIGKDSWDITHAATGFVCAFQDGGYTGLNMKSNEAHGFACEEIKIIGNVHQNKRLFKSTKK